jgi:hypothetical protein
MDVAGRIYMDAPSVGVDSDMPLFVEQPSSTLPKAAAPYARWFPAARMQHAVTVAPSRCPSETAVQLASVQLTTSAPATPTSLPVPACDESEVTDDAGDCAVDWAGASPPATQALR